MRVLIAEDDTSSRIILQRAVEQLGHECVAAKDGIEAWRLVREAPVDVIITDWMMPGMDGMELCRRVREEPRRTYTYVIFLTALADREHLLRGIRAGADDYLPKPLDRNELQVRLLVAARVTTLHQRFIEQNGELERLNLQLHDQARRDHLTNLGNRLRLQEELASLVGRVARYGHCYCAVLVDVDHFKLYNDHYGHAAGDAVLRTLADSLQKHNRTGDAAYRYGGEEFLIVLPEQTLDRAAIAVERLRQAVQALAIAHDGNHLSGVVTISAGISIMEPGDNKSVETWLKEADLALYQAKHMGRNRVVVYGSSEASTAPRNEQVEATLLPSTH
ncbi:MAG TPA: diguanylate cyclase [Ardenticatenaceae bacterium]